MLIYIIFYSSSLFIDLSCKSTELGQNDELILQSPTNPLEEQDEDIHLAPVAEILKFLYIGNERDAANKDIIDSLAITHVLNVTSHLPEHFKSSGIIYKRLPANDSSQQDLMKYFDQAFEFIETARKDNGKVLVHCQAGVSRSVTVTISYILRKSYLNAYEGYKFVKSKRPVASPNLNFMGQLMSFEQALNKGEIERQLEAELKFEVLDKN
ncbi:DgyrCDS12187 [Dimorphilus gyrociliatus]|uniref:protein-tyrosine-phosphatase n=1 Tax=Dimorphilus gyrociliatus TaxID=2664684 RepID=A0A7I8W7V7_9ANNE|nr:DgyrCDS12187 [Dimorphilus gyrociliatus]